MSKRFDIKVVDIKIVDIEVIGFKIVNIELISKLRFQIITIIVFLGLNSIVIFINKNG